MVQIVKHAEVEDAILQAIVPVLNQYEAEHEGSECQMYRYNPGSIRIRVIDPRFQGMSKGDRHELVMAYFDAVSDDILAEISVLLCLAPGERSWMNLEFETPSRSHF